MSQPKYQQVAAHIRDQIANGTLKPGQPAPSGAALARETGYSTLTCRKALNKLIKDGTLIPGTSPRARPRVPARTATNSERTLDVAGRALSESLAARRHAAGLTQPQLAQVIGMSLTAIGHAETGRLWHSRQFWERADKALNADGELLAIHDAYRAATVPAEPATSAEGTSTETATDAAVDIPPAVAVAISGLLTCVTITWANGETTAVYPPRMSSRNPSTSQSVLTGDLIGDGYQVTAAEVEGAVGAHPDFTGSACS